jgi:threonylcarbamoyladenosine tRNA methylthiotransferase MtaB
LLARFLESRIGQGEDVLIEQPGFGRTEHYAPVRLAGGAPGDLIHIVAGSHASGELTGLAA